MPTYCTQAELDDEFGEANVITWSNKDNRTQTVDADAVAAAIARASDIIDDRFRDSRYSVPITATSGGSGGIPRTVRMWACILAGYHLYVARGLRDEDTMNKMQGRRDDAMKDISFTLAGTRRLAAALTESGSPSAPVVAR